MPYVLPGSNLDQSIQAVQVATGQCFSGFRVATGAASAAHSSGGFASTAVTELKLKFYGSLLSTANSAATPYLVNIGGSKALRVSKTSLGCASATTSSYKSIPASQMATFYLHDIMGVNAGGKARASLTFTLYFRAETGLSGGKIFYEFVY